LHRSKGFRLAGIPGGSIEGSAGTPARLLNSRGFAAMVFAAGRSARAPLPHPRPRDHRRPRRVAGGEIDEKGRAPVVDPFRIDENLFDAPDPRRLVGLRVKMLRVARFGI